MLRALFATSLVLAIILLGMVAGRGVPAAAGQVDPAACEPWQVPETRLKDHTIFQFEGVFYALATSIQLPAQDERGEYRFAFARSADLCQWETLGWVLEPGPPGSPDEGYLWAPHVVEEAGTYYLFYTGVNQAIAQSIMVATSTNPANPTSWQRQGVVFRPNHPGMVYPGPEAWSNARDPMVLRYRERYYLFYTGLDEAGGIVGVAVADTLLGPWQDLGATLLDTTPAFLESPFVLEQGGYYYLFYNRATGQPDTHGSAWRWAPSPFGPWQPPSPTGIGWAHDFLRVGEGWHVSFVLGSGEAVAVTPLRWHTGTPPAPSVGAAVFLPAVTGAAPP